MSGFINERDVGRIAVGARVNSVDDVNSRTLDEPTLASVHGGGIPVEVNSQGSLISARGIYRVSLTPEPNIDAPIMVTRGVTRIEGAHQSLIARAWNRI